MMDRIDELGYAAWDEFYTQMSTRYQTSRGRGDQYWTHRHYKALRRIGKLCLDNNIDVRDYIDTNFTTLTRSNHRYITPKDFATTKALERYIKHNSNHGQNAFAGWISQVQILADFETRMIPKLYESSEEILANFKTPFTSWFRLMYHKPFSDRLFDLFGELAYTELRKDRRLRDFIRKRAGENLRELERRIGQFGDLVNEGATGL